MWQPLLQMVNNVKWNSCLIYSSYDEVTDLTETLSPRWTRWTTSEWIKILHRLFSWQMAHFKTRSKNSGWHEGRLMHPNLLDVSPRFQDTAVSLRGHCSNGMVGLVYIIQNMWMCAMHNPTAPSFAHAFLLQICLYFTHLCVLCSSCFLSSS